MMYDLGVVSQKRSLKMKYEGVYKKVGRYVNNGPKKSDFIHGCFLIQIFYLFKY